MKRLTTIICGIIILMGLPACMNGINDNETEDKLTVEIGAQSLDISTGTKSSYLEDEAAAETVNNFNVFIFDAGNTLVYRQFSPDASNVGALLINGSSYSVSILANMGDITSQITSLGELESYRHPVSTSGIQQNGLPMYGSRTIQATSSPVQIPVTRLVAQYEFRLDKSAIEGGTLALESLTVRNIPNVFHPCGTEFKAASGQIADSGDYASPADINAVNGGAGICFYVPENMQGIEYGLSDPKKKLPKAEDGAYNYSTVDTDYCTYIEARCTYDNGSSRGVTYRMMLGGDNTSDFNIVRNTKYIVTLKPTGNPLLSNWWKCEPDNIEKILTSIEVSPSSQTAEIGDIKSFSAIAHWSDGTWTVVTNDPGTTWTVTSGAACISATGNKGEYRAGAPGTSTVQAAYNGKTGSAQLTIKPKADVCTYQLVVFAGPENTTWTATVGEGEQHQYRAFLRTYINGVLNSSLTTEKTNQCNWSSDDTSIATVDSYGLAKGISSGTTKIRATYSGYSDYGEIVVSSFEPTITHSLEISPSEQGVSVGSTASFSATYHTFTNGVDDGGVDVTDSATWTITSGSSYASAGAAKGEYEGKSAGTASIKASYSGYDATASLTVGNVVTYSLAVSPDPAEVTVGEDISFTATLYKATNGVDDSGTDVTSSCTWAISEGGSYASTTETAGQVHGDAAGTATVTAVHEKAEGSATLTVKKPDDVITYELAVSPSSQNAKVGDNVSFSATYYKLTNGVKDGGTDVTSTATWSVVSGPASTTATKGMFKASGSGTATIEASYGGNDATATIVITDVVTYELAVSPSSRNAKVGENVSFSATYYKLTNGVKDGGTDVTSSASWSVVSGPASKTGQGQYKANSAGTAVIRANYSGKEASGSIVITDNVSYELVVSPASQTIKVGEYASFTATYYTITNGVRNSGQNVTSSATWSVLDSSPVYAVNKQSAPGLFRGEAQGSGTIQASYKGLTDSASVTVKAAPVYITHVKVVYRVYDLENGSQGGTTRTIDSGWVAVPNANGANDLGNIAKHQISIMGTDACSFRWDYTVSYKLSTGSEGNAMIKSNQPGGFEWNDNNFIKYTVSNTAWTNSASFEFGPYN